MPGMLKIGCPLLSVVGSGQFGTPWERMHRAKSSMPLVIRGTWAWVGWSSCAQALWAAWSWEVLTPTCCGVTLGTPPLLVGSGKAGTPCERMQWEKATAWELAAWELAGPPAFDEPPGPVDDGLLPHAAVSRARAAATLAAAARAAGGPGRRAVRRHGPSPLSGPGRKREVGFMAALLQPGQ